MKVGILSMQRVRNYGSYLQALGLKLTIESLGHEVCFVDYKVEPCIGSKRGIKNTWGYEKARRMYRFIKKYTGLSIRCGDPDGMKFISQYDNKYLPALGVSEKRRYRSKVDILVIGSDEVFNCLQQNPEVGFSKELFGYGNRAKKVITYAASFGNTTLHRLKQYGVASEIKKLLENISVISVRDKNSGRIIRALTKKEPFYHLDPVLISDFTGYMVDHVKQKNYIIVYAYGDRISKEEEEHIKAFAKKEKKKLIAISGKQKFCEEHPIVSPFEVLAYFKHADYIITDTFHGSIFSIINNRPFVTIVRKSVEGSYGNEEKLTDLLTRLKLERRMIQDLTSLEEQLKEEIDYKRVNVRIKEQRQNTLEYLKKNLSGNSV